MLHYFDACKIGLTATPELHTPQIFGAPIYSYSYREAVIDGFIRQATIGDVLLPYSERVNHALQRILASKASTAPQRDWLKRIAAQTTANLLIDREALDDPDLVVKRDGGGFTRFDKIFNGPLQQVLEAFNDSMRWQDARPAA